MGAKGPRLRRILAAFVSCLTARLAPSAQEVAVKMVAKKAKRARRERLCCIVIWVGCELREGRALVSKAVQETMNEGAEGSVE